MRPAAARYFFPLVIYLLLGCFITATPAQTTGKESTAQGIVFKVEGGKAPLYLCGSIHLMQEADYPLPKAYETAFQQAQRVVMEIPPEEADPVKAMPAMMKYALLKQGTFQQTVAPKTYDAVAAWAKEAGSEMSSLEKFRPWLVSLIITQQAYEASGMKAERGIDVYFKKQLEDAEPKKASGGLETLDDQFQLLSGFEAKIQEEMILQSIAEAKEAQQELQLLLDAWRTGDTAAIAKTMAESFAKMPAVGKLLLQDRNARWLPKLQQMLAAATPTMVLVGAGHLCGDGSVVELLRKAGFVVTQVKS